MVMEAVHMKVLAQDAEARVAAEKKQEIKEFKTDFSALENFR